MNWIDLPEDWFQMSDPDKFRWYAAAYCASSESINNDNSYFVSSRKCPGANVPDISEYDFSYFAGIEKAFNGISEHLAAGNTGLLCRMTAAALLKNKPHEKERIDSGRWQESERVITEKTQPHSAPGTVSKHESSSPPDFFYPM